MTENAKLIRSLSDGLADAVEKGQSYTVLVDGRPGYPASGTYYSQKHVIASNHSVHINEGIRIETPDGESVDAQVTGRDPVHDIVLLELEAEVGMRPPVVGRTPRVGELALALARPSEDGIQSSLGVIGVAGGTYIGGHGPAMKDMIRSDAAQFPGFAGGPLIDVEGNLIGVNIMGHRHGSFLTIPAERAFAAAERITQHGDIKQAYLGIRSQPAEIPGTVDIGREQVHGLLIVGVEEASPAMTAGMITGDMVVAVDGVPTSSPGQLLDFLAEQSEGDAVELELIRGGVLLTQQMHLGGKEYEQHRGHRHHHGKRGRRRGQSGPHGDNR